MSPTFGHLLIGLDRPTLKPGPYDHFVRIEIPERGLGNKLNAMKAWATARGERMPAARSDRKQPDWWSFIIYGFTDAATADAFAAEFEGKRL